MSSNFHLRILVANPAIGDRGNLHLYLPKNASGAVPFVFGIHGGSWSHGDQTSYHFLWEILRPLGIGLVLASYRMAPEHPFPAAYDDLLVALAWLKSKGDELGLDTSRCLLLGASAGGHLAMLLATRAITEDRPRPTFCGVAQYCGIMDLTAQEAADEKRGGRMTRNFLGTTPAENSELYRAASPLAHVHANMPPVWMAHGSADLTVPFTQSQAMVDRLRLENQDVIFLEGRGLGHTMREFSASGKQVDDPAKLLFERDLLRFVQRHTHSTNADH